MAALLDLMASTEIQTSREHRPLCSGRLVAVEESGLLRVDVPEHGQMLAAWLECTGALGVELAVGDELLISLTAHPTLPVVLGRIGRYVAPGQAQSLVIQAQERVELRVGQATVELRNSGQVLVSGEDVLLRAKGTQRIRAGTVAIN